MTERTNQVMAEIKQRFEAQSKEAKELVENFVNVHIRYDGSFGADLAAELKELYGIDISPENIEAWIIPCKKKL